MFLSMSKPLRKIAGKLTKIAIAIGSGALMGMTLPPVEAWYLAWVALAPLWYLLCRRDTGKTVYAFGWGLGCYGLGLSWIFGIHPMTWMGVPWIESFTIAGFCLAFIGTWGASLVVLWGLGLRLIYSKVKIHPGVRVVLGTALWCGLERLYSLTDLWWTSLALTQSPHNLSIVHLGQLSGPTTIAAVIVAVNGLIAEGFLAIKKYAPQAILSAQQGKHKNYGRELYPEYLPAPQNPAERAMYLRVKTKIALPYLSTAIGLLIVSHLLGLALLNRPPIQPIESALKVGIIQGNISHKIKHYRAGHQNALDRYTNGYQELVDRGVDIVVTPETALPFTETDLKKTKFYQAILDRKVLALVGAFGEVGRGFTNSILTITGDGNIFSRYDKWKLVPLGEYIPFEQIIGKFINRISPLNFYVVGGPFAPIVNTPVGNIIFGICYDSAYAEHFRQQALKGDFIVIASNNSFYGDGMAMQHHAGSPPCRRNRSLDSPRQ
jgi:apolipoprotein N-acyltransferase